MTLDDYPHPTPNHLGLHTFHTDVDLFRTTGPLLQYNELPVDRRRDVHFPSCGVPVPTDRTHPSDPEETRDTEGSYPVWEPDTTCPRVQSRDPKIFVKKRPPLPRDPVFRLPNGRQGSLKEEPTKNKSQDLGYNPVTNTFDNQSLGNR